MSPGLESSRPSAASEESTATRSEVVPPYRVILHNDDVTPMDFVTDTLTRYFIPDPQKAAEVMFVAHREGTALVAIMPLEHAEFKVSRAHERARAHGYPLTFSIEPCEK